MKQAIRKNLSLCLRRFYVSRREIEVAEDEKESLWARNLFSDLGKLKGRLILMRMG